MELKEVLHLYLGCECIVGTKKGKMTAIQSNVDIVVWRSDEDSRMGHYIRSGEIKPILRPLSDMTEEEYEYVLSNFNLVSRGKTVQQFIIGWRAFTPECTLYLLSKHFDLFGLIESGQAIDKTTIQQ